MANEGRGPGFNEILKGIELPASLEIINKLQKWISSEIASVAEFGICVKSDPALAAKILKIANSPYYGGQDIGNIERAMTLIGSNSLALLVMSMEIVATFKGLKLPSHHLIWRRNLYTATVAKLLAKETMRSEDRLFSIGLLRGAGRLVFYARRPDIAEYSLTVAAERSIALIEAERELVGYHHAELGATLLENWRVPESVTQVIRHYSTPDTAPEAYQIDAAIVHLAYNLTCRFYDLPYIPPARDYLQIITGVPDGELMDKIAMQAIHAHKAAISMILA